MVCSQQKTVKVIVKIEMAQIMIKLGEKLNVPVKHLADKIISECYQNQCFKLLRFQKTLINDCVVTNFD